MTLRWKAVLASLALVVGVIVPVALAPSAGAFATPTATCTHGQTGTQDGALTNPESVIKGATAWFGGTLDFSQAATLCSPNTPDINNKAFFGLQLEDTSGHYFFVGGGTRAAEHDCTADGQGNGHLVYTWTGEPWHGLNNDRGCLPDGNVAFSIQKVSGNTWRAEYCDAIGSGHCFNAVDITMAFTGSLVIKVMDGIGYGGNSDTWGQNDGSDFEHINTVLYKNSAGQSVSLCGSFPFFGYHQGTYTNRLSGVIGCDSMDVYMNVNAS